MGLWKLFVQALRTHVYTRINQTNKYYTINILRQTFSMLMWCVMVNQEKLDACVYQDSANTQITYDKHFLEKNLLNVDALSSGAQNLAGDRYL